MEIKLLSSYINQFIQFFFNLLSSITLRNNTFILWLHSGSLPTAEVHGLDASYQYLSFEYFHIFSLM